MAIVDDSDFQTWVKAYDKLDAVSRRYKAAVDTWGEDHQISKRVKENKQIAETEYDRIVSSLS